MRRDGPPVRGWQSPAEVWRKLREPANSFRRNPTEAEAALWQVLRNRGVAGAKFRRQHAIGRYIVDFYCAEARLAIEVDGAVHVRRAEQDRIRQQHLEKTGLMLLRFSNEEVLRDPGSVERVIATTVTQRRHPLSEIGEGEGVR